MHHDRLLLGRRLTSELEVVEVGIRVVSVAYVASFGLVTVSTFSTATARLCHILRRVTTQCGQSLCLPDGRYYLHLPILPLDDILAQPLSPYCQPWSSTSQTPPFESSSSDSTGSWVRSVEGLGECSDCSRLRLEDLRRSRPEASLGRRPIGLDAGLIDHSGSNHRHSVVRFRQEAGSDRVGDGV